MAIQMLHEHYEKTEISALGENRKGKKLLYFSSDMEGLIYILIDKEGNQNNRQNAKKIKSRKYFESHC